MISWRTPCAATSPGKYQAPGRLTYSLIPHILLVMNNGEEIYHGFEQGPIRPPSEASSLFIRVTRNCPWNKCTFCPVYKGAKFSSRPTEHVKRDIDEVWRHVGAIQKITASSGTFDRQALREYSLDFGPAELMALQAAYHWLFTGGMKSVFLQDANSLIIKPANLVEILEHLKSRFPNVERITSYARAQTVAHRKDDELKAIAEAGLNRIHLGLESGSDKILNKVQKGVTKEDHIKAGCKVRQAGMELSEYVMPGLGGRTLSVEHARETANALNQINPDFIRLRTLAIPPGIPLFDEYQNGEFDKCTDIQIAREILLLLENLKGITSKLRSDHILNLFEDLEGTFPDDQQRLIKILRSFLNLDPEKQRVYQLGRRLGIFHGLADMDSPHRLARAERACRQLNVTAENVDRVTDELMTRFV
ncbi:radical SAM protein [Candidatus Zixiibacteriota bacterium]